MTVDVSIPGAGHLCVGCGLDSPVAILTASLLDGVGDEHRRTCELEAPVAVGTGGLDTVTSETRDTRNCKIVVWLYLPVDVPRHQKERVVTVGGVIGLGEPCWLGRPRARLNLTPVIGCRY